MAHSSKMDMEAEVEKLRDRYYRDMEEEKAKNIEKIRKLKKSYDYGVIAFIFMCSFLSVAMHRNINYNNFETYMKNKFPIIYEKMTDINYDMESYNMFECSLIVAAYHYLMYKIILHRFVVLISCVMFGLYISIQMF